MLLGLYLLQRKLPEYNQNFKMKLRPPDARWHIGPQGGGVIVPISISQSGEPVIFNSLSFDEVGIVEPTNFKIRLLLIAFFFVSYLLDRELRKYAADYPWKHVANSSAFLAF